MFNKVNESLREEPPFFLKIFFFFSVLEESPPVINWSREVSRFYPLWNRTAGDCLLDSLLQSTWGILDQDGALRKALDRSLKDDPGSR